MEDHDKDWYTYLSSDFKLDRKQYKVADRVVVDCPRCWTTSVIRISHLKDKIKKLGYFECSKCRKTDSAARARAAFKKKHGVDNPGQLEHVRIGNLRTKDGKKQCTGCGECLSLDNFYKKGKYYNSKCRECHNAYQRDYKPNYIKVRKDKDINFKLAGNLRTRIGNALRNDRKPGSAVKDMGCTVGELKLYLESKFQDGMSWENYGEWHIDHIRPLSSFNLEDRDEFLKACHYTNLQPLWTKDNISKGAKWNKKRELKSSP